MTSPKRPARPRSGQDSGPAAPPFGDLLSRSFEVGYRAFDDYVQQGQRIVQRVSEGASSSEVLGTDVQDLGARMMRHASDMLGTWLDALGNRPAPAATRSEPPAGSPAGDVGPAPAHFRLRVVSPRQVETMLELRTGSLPSRVTARELRTSDATTAPLAITTTAMSAAAGVALEVVVAGDQAAGIYDVLLLDGTDETPLGVLRVIVR